MSSYGLWLSAAGMQLQDHRQAILATNMANAHTTGFKRDVEVVSQRDVESRMPGRSAFAHAVLDGMSGGMAVKPTYLSLDQGPIERTERPLDAAIEGDGFFVVRDDEQERYTRNGAFAMNAAGELVLATAEGQWRVQSQDGGPITASERGGRVKISDDGTVRQGRSVLGQIKLVTAEDPQAFRKVGENMFWVGEETTLTPANGRVVSESLEQSNFDAMQGLATMIEATRAYQLNATMLQLQDQITGQAVNRVARVA